MSILCPAIIFFSGKTTHHYGKWHNGGRNSHTFTGLNWHNDDRNGWHNMAEMGGTMTTEIASFQFINISKAPADERRLYFSDKSLLFIFAFLRFVIREKDQTGFVMFRSV